MGTKGKFENIEASEKFTRKRLRHIQIDLSDLDPDGVSVVVNGSYARGEASPQSDFDYFLLAPKEIDPAKLDRIAIAVRSVIGNVVGKEPSVAGPFSQVERIGEFARVIGGGDDTNSHITRRILFLTEGKAVCGSEVFDRERENLVNEMYLREVISDHQLGLFLLNDIIRYYRTVGVDFEYKTVQNAKPWGIRNVKLVFSRKLLYFAGVLICAELYQRTAKQKRARALELMAMTPIERLTHVCGGAAQNALRDYDYFLELIGQEAVRKEFERVKEDRNTHTELFRAMKNRGHHFSMHLLNALEQTYHSSHPIHKALIL